MAQAALRILAVDDEQPQLEDLARLLRASPLVEWVDCASDGHDALIKASSGSFDAIFLDVRMPNLDGVELGRVLRQFAAPPQLVFVTAYDSAAVDAFELRATDYLLKPVARRRLDEALTRVAAAAPAAAGEVANGTERGASHESDVIALENVRSGTRRLVSRSAILFAQSHGDFVRVVADDGRYLLRATLTDVEHRWAPHGFVRVHRQYVANLNRAVELRPQLGGTAELAFPGGQTIPVARRHVAELGRRLRA